MEKVKVLIIISGRVQGVFYRKWTIQNAKKLELKGWVRNLSDGRVEAVFEGEKDKVEEMLKRCKEGPRLASVKNIKVKWERYGGELDGFGVKVED